ncbi:MAG: lipopolysaccharide assembly protein LapA domain-containing protein [Sphingopyxis sp.]|uniref:lipopolysaccharide assembly protein LapA domain-containing protein n=1 Tax=Sphingopyxis sp. TaxID=1908224 RepID=UPI003D6D4CA4
MGIVRTIIWVLLTAVLVIFSMANWIPVTVTIWPGQVLDTKLPVLILVSFLIGTIPLWIALRAARWSLKRRLDHSDRQLADLRAMANRPAEPAAPAPVAAPAATTVGDIPPSLFDKPTETP